MRCTRRKETDCARVHSLIILKFYSNFPFFRPNCRHVRHSPVSVFLFSCRHQFHWFEMCAYCIWMVEKWVLVLEQRPKQHARKEMVAMKPIADLNRLCIHLGDTPRIQQTETTTTNIHRMAKLPQMSNGSFLFFLFLWLQVSSRESTIGSIYKAIMCSVGQAIAVMLWNVYVCMLVHA